MFQGPCKAASIGFNLQGILQAPAEPSKFTSQDGWVVFQNINGLVISGGGTFDGQGALAWSQNDCAKTGKCNKLPIVSTSIAYIIVACNFDAFREIVCRPFY